MLKKGVRPSKSRRSSHTSLMDCFDGDSTVDRADVRHEIKFSHFSPPDRPTRLSTVSIEPIEFNPDECPYAVSRRAFFKRAPDPVAAWYLDASEQERDGILLYWHEHLYRHNGELAAVRGWVPLFPFGGYSPEAKCAHKPSKIHPGFVCMVCHLASLEFVPEPKPSPGELKRRADRVQSLIELLNRSAEVTA